MSRYGMILYREDSPHIRIKEVPTLITRRE